MVLMRSLIEFVIIFVTTETLNTINSRTLVLASYGGGKLTVKCPSPETLRGRPLATEQKLRGTRSKVWRI